MKKVLLGCGIASVVLVLVIVLIAGYIGFIPGLSNKMVRRVDLGIENDPQLTIQHMEEYGLENQLQGAEPSMSELQFEGQVEVDDTFDSADATSGINTAIALSHYNPISNFQARMNEDGTVETSFDLDVNMAVEVAKRLGYSDEEIDKGKKYLKVLSSEIYVYAKFKGGVENNDVMIEPQSLRIQNFNVPGGFLEPIAGVVDSAFEKAMGDVEGMDIEQIRQEGEQVRFKGSLPQVIKK